MGIRVLEPETSPASSADEKVKTQCSALNGWSGPGSCCKSKSRTRSEIDSPKARGMQSIARHAETGPASSNIYEQGNLAFGVVTSRCLPTAFPASSSLLITCPRCEAEQIHLLHSYIARRRSRVLRVWNRSYWDSCCVLLGSSCGTCRL